ncbi:MAG: hypothetical protein CTY19_16500 [Methylomonas sp.]|nr:MAG: hypothetical protein CTY19_16500 [Methylomonas sp.]
MAIETLFFLIIKILQPNRDGHAHNQREIGTVNAFWIIKPVEIYLSQLKCCVTIPLPFAGTQKPKFEVR